MTYNFIPGPNLLVRNYVQLELSFHIFRFGGSHQSRVVPRL